MHGWAALGHGAHGSRRVVSAILVEGVLIIALSACAGGGEGTLKSAAPTPTVASAEDFAVNMQGCLREAGWETTISADGGLSSSVPDAQADAYRAAHDACLTKFGYDLPPAAMDRETAEAYLAAVVAAADCLTAAGYDVPARPAEAESLEGLMSPDLDPRWDIYGNVPDGPELQKAQSSCPIKD